MWWVAVLWGVFTVVVGYILFFYPALSLTKITIRGGERLPHGELLALTQAMLSGQRWRIFPAANFFVVPKNKIEATLKEQYPLLRSVTVQTVFPGELILELKERPKLWLWCAGGPCALLDEGDHSVMHVHALDPQYENDRLMVIDTSALPIVAGEALPVKEYFEFLEAFEKRAPERLGVTINTLATTPSRFSRELHLTTSAGWQLLVSTARPFEETLQALQVFLDDRKKSASTASPLVSVDVRVPGRIFYTDVASSQTSSPAIPADTPVLSEPDRKKKK